MAKRMCFVSFDYDHDRHYKYLLEAWDANPDFDFSFADRTPGEINSSNVGAIKAALTAKINSATHTLVIIGQYANSPHPKRDLIGFKNWINFEINRSKASRNKVVAIKIDRSYESPDELSGANASWAFAFEEQAILRALREA
ncbi:MAG: TIR domain-containing protein [Candidatus Eisenbacteria bacterium]